MANKSTPLVLTPTPNVVTGARGSGESFETFDEIVLPADYGTGPSYFVDPASEAIYPLWHTVKGAPPAIKTNNTTQSDATEYQRRADFYKFMRARGYVLGSYYVGTEIQGVKVWNVYEKTATGSWRSVGKNFIVPEIFDGVFWAVAKLAASIITAGGSDLVVASGEAATNDTAEGYQNLAVSYAKAYVGAYDGGGADTATTAATATQGVTAMDEYDFWGDGFNFSSGEADFAFSDAQNVDFGFGQDSMFDQYPATDWGYGDVYDFGSGSGGYDFGGTPEVTTNDFGTVFSNDWGSEATKVATKALPVAVSATKVLNKPSTGQVAGVSAKGDTTNDVLAGLMNVFGVVKQAAAGVNQQTTTSKPQTSTGQLTPQGGAGGSPVSYTHLRAHETM
jgi:hypothetical protein